MGHLYSGCVQVFANLLPSLTNELLHFFCTLIFLRVQLRKVCDPLIDFDWHMNFGCHQRIIGHEYRV